MKDSIKKQIIFWKEELTKQVQTRDKARKLFEDSVININVLQGGIQFGESLLKNIESESQPTGIVELDRSQEQKPKR